MAMGGAGTPAMVVVGEFSADLFFFWFWITNGDMFFQVWAVLGFRMQASTPWAEQRNDTGYWRK
jgi:hypothetical protein